MHGFFITGTDTGVGKTTIAAALLHRLAQSGRRTAGMKPVAAGCHHTTAGWRNEDALQLLAHGNVTLSYEEVNPLALPAPWAPHLAARAAGIDINVDLLHAAYLRLRARADTVVVEGAGGWLVPLTAHETMADLAARMNLPVIMVVGMRLGCLNHALLTAEAVGRHGLQLVGWVANCIDPDMEEVAGNIEALETRLAVPRLATFSHRPSTTVAERAAELDLRPLGDRVR